MYASVASVAYVIDRILGEFGFIRHPVVLMGDYIKWFERHFYANSIVRGALLTLSLIALVYGVAYGLTVVLSGWEDSYLQLLITGIIASTTIASKMLYDSVKAVITTPESIRYLVSRDTENLTPSQINKAAIETYAENLSDGVIAPLLYLLLFGLPGAFVYKAINTLDSMVGYKNQRYEKFGKFAARLDDVANFIPARVTAVLIVLLAPKRADRANMESTPTHKDTSHKGSAQGTTPTQHHIQGVAQGTPPTPINKSVAKQRIPSLFTKVFHNGKHHPSPNAGYPIAAMAYVLGIKLGGPTSYFGKVVPKAYFGEGREVITQDDIRNALKLQPRLDIVILLLLGIGAWL